MSGPAPRAAFIPAFAPGPAAPERGIAGWQRRVRPAPGPIRFARYAFGPNRLGYCGPDASAELFAQATRGGDLGKLRELAAQFEGAYPYLALIARANGRPDPLAAEVVEAYWLGGRLAAGVRPRLLGDSLEDRFRRRIPGDRWRWLAAAAEAGAVPNHAFHVLDVFPKVGLLRTAEIDRVVETMDACRIRWGRVLERDGDCLVVSTVPLELVEGKLGFGAPRIERVRGWVDGSGFVEDAAAGDVVSMHWDWACERLDPRRLAQLRRSTEAELRVANATI
jgi:hypothetical protein